MRCFLNRLDHAWKCVPQTRASKDQSSPGHQGCLSRKQLFIC